MRRDGGSAAIVGSSGDLANSGSAITFRVRKQNRIFPAFVVRFEGKVRAFLNVCPHAGLRLNRDSPEVFHSVEKYLFCTAHGAGFDPKTGACVVGPSVGLSLIKLNVREAEGVIVLQEEEYQLYD